MGNLKHEQIKCPLFQFDHHRSHMDCLGSKGCDRKFDADFGVKVREWRYTRRQQDLVFAYCFLFCNVIMVAGRFGSDSNPLS